MNYQHRKVRHPKAYQPGQILRGPRKAALIAVSFLVSVMSLASFGESYQGLYEWASRHALSGIWAGAWPLMLDSFIAVGELALFAGLCDGWPKRSRIGAWSITAVGLEVSVAGNIGHVSGHSTPCAPPIRSRATAGRDTSSWRRQPASCRLTRCRQPNWQRAPG